MLIQLRLGGEKGIRETLNILYQIVTTDTRIKEFFDDKKIKKIKEGQTKYFIEMFGGPKKSTTRELYAIHETLGINDFHFDAFIGDFQRAMLGTGIDEVVMDEVMITIEQVRPQVMGRKTVEVAGVMKNGKSLLMRLGGDMNLESLVENM
ncbi:Myoglobin, putative [Perkinsus marinus ATCC 50983]|uniref:Myoglobin, putative n=1 Tax=Perkinsus marinus (strain ATCC 50983 / TXsc) TaxID=423536 RepID=C5L3D1_PERM5|nr:Myoglobin, putative [Perkinsus marinus ATCC 50983]EER08762.1 Myoglobin, putative [Perkinsus marinus ATCC 50983]|eukprot:XP_002776946.1 Myoglobin, putative [Perkinsus marinus ATCC 50983]